MQFKNLNTKNWLKLKEIAKSKRCHICSYKLKKTAVYIWNKKANDTTHIKCFNCLTIYNTDFNITEVGIPQQIGEA